MLSKWRLTHLVMFKKKSHDQYSTAKVNYVYNLFLLFCDVISEEAVLMQCCHLSWIYAIENIARCASYIFRFYKS